MQSISIIIPTFNESENIKFLIEEIFYELSKLQIIFEIIIIDDSNDKEATKLLLDLSLEEKYKKCINVHFRINSIGLASALRLGIEKASNEVLVLMDADLSHSPSDVVRMLKKLELTDKSEHRNKNKNESENENKNQVIWGCRYYDNHIKKLFFRDSRDINLTQYLQWILNRICNFFLNLFFKFGISDITNGFIVCERKCFEKIPYEKIFYGYGDFSFRLAYYWKIKKIQMSEYRYRYQKRVHGKSKTKLFKTSIRYFLEMLILKRSF